MIKVSYKNKIWSLNRELNTLTLIDVSDESNIFKIERKEFEDLLRENIIVFWDNYNSKKQISSLKYFENNKDISEKDKIKIEIIKKYIHIGRDFNKIDFCKYVKNELNINMSEITIYRVITAFEDSGNTMTFLLSKRQIHRSRIENNIQKIILDCIKKDYANPHRKTIKTLYERIKIELYKLNVKREKIPTYQTVCNYVHKYSHELEIEKKRLGNKEYYKRYGAVFNGVPTTYPLE